MAKRMNRKNTRRVNRKSRKVTRANRKSRKASRRMNRRFSGGFFQSPPPSTGTLGNIPTVNTTTVSAAAVRPPGSNAPNVNEVKGMQMSSGTRSASRGRAGL